MKQVKKKFVIALAASWILASFDLVEAQQAAKFPRIGFLASSSGERLESRLAAFRESLRELGYVEGKNIAIELRYASGQFDKLPSLAQELIRLKVDVLVAEGAPAAHAAKNATHAIPIVIGNAADPVGTGLVSSLAHPGGNITGLSDFNLNVVTKRLELIKEVVPSASRVAVLLNPGNPTNPLQLKEIQAAAPALGVKLVPFEAKEPDDIDRAFAGMRNERAAAVLVFGDPMFGSYQKRIVDLAFKNRLPAIYGSSDNMVIGGLMSYGTNFADLYRRAAVYVDKILRGAKPADLPVEQPTKLELVINLKAAKQIGLTIPPNVLARADKVIK
jgi:putative tryptophan/tyrosine transport system substrate-binding protein